MKKKEKRNPWSFVPTQYFAEGLPFVLVNQLSVAMFKSLQVSNLFIGFSSFLYLPWSLKLFWGPVVDATLTKRKWVVMLQLILAACFALLGLGLQFNLGIFFTLIIFSIIAFASATHDIATDGFYLHALDDSEQALFSGIRNTFYRFSMIFGGGILVSLAGSIGKETGVISYGWSMAFYISSAIFLLFFFYHGIVIPQPISDKESENKLSIPYKKIFIEYFTQKRIVIIIAFILLYRFGEGLLLKMVQPFLLDNRFAGGLGLSLGEVGVVYGTIGVVALLIGGILGGWSVKKYGLKKLFIPLALIMHLPNLFFVYLSAYQPDVQWNMNLSWISNNILVLSFHPLVLLSVMIEQFAYGLGFTAFMIYLMYISKGDYKTSHYAISTGLMALGMIIPGMLSGIIQSNYGYHWLFIMSFFLTIPGLLTIFFLPFDFKEISLNKEI